jgi:hypothetical protein
MKLAARSASGSCCHVPDMNCGPLSVVISVGRPNLMNQPLGRAARQASVEVEARGKTSSYRVLLSMAVRRWVEPSAAVGRGPTRST